MERGIRHARVLAFIDAPLAMINRCIASQGRSYKDKSFAIDENLRGWITQFAITDVAENTIIPTGKLQSDKLFDSGLSDSIAEGIKP